MAACRSGDDVPQRSVVIEVTYPDPDPGQIKGFFLLNEANMGSNKVSLDYYDYETGRYHRNIFPERNPGVYRELGDVGNDLKVYDDKLWAVINHSNYVEVMELATARHIAKITIPNCRYIAFDGKFAYVSSYAGEVQIDKNSRLGYVAKIDIETLEVVGKCDVGYQPEQMVVAGDKLYVANSGGYRVPNYDRTVSVINLETFTEIKKIDVAINLHRMELDRYGNLWVSSRGDNKTILSKMFVIDTKTDTVTDTLELPCANMARRGDSLYIIGTSPEKRAKYLIINTRTKTVTDSNFIKDGTEKKMKTPYGIALNPATGDILLTDAGDYITPGTLHCYSREGVHKWSVTAGDIPAHIAFTTEKLRPVD